MTDKKARVNRQTVDLSEFPDLVVIYLGMRVQKARGVGKLLRTGRQISAAVAGEPDGLLLHENLVFSLLPPHLGMRQYWRDLDSLERWTRELPHQQWWKDFLRDPGGTGFWHETYFMRGGMEAIYDDVAKPVGMASFAPLGQALGRTFSTRSRLGLGKSELSAVVPEQELAD
ncbi:MAG TPA: phenylacetaldoxime dehydratase family protein [Acidimicrobiales bacterium]|nr:phenylacetaldoxime dehydratase family protein [Acidimicrobiales bacterium]